MVGIIDIKTSDLSGKQLCWVNINIWEVSMTGFETVIPAFGLVFGVANTDWFSMFGLAMRACVAAQNSARSTPLLVTLHLNWNSIVGGTIPFLEFGGSNMVR